MLHCYGDFDVYRGLNLSTLLRSALRVASPVDLDLFVCYGFCMVLLRVVFLGRLAKLWRCILIRDRYCIRLKRPAASALMLNFQPPSS